MGRRLSHIYLAELDLRWLEQCNDKHRDASFQSLRRHIFALNFHERTKLHNDNYTGMSSTVSPSLSLSLFLSAKPIILQNVCTFICLQL